MTKIGRNDPCPCGSGKKYKKCCLANEVAPVVDFGWRKMRSTEGEMMPLLLAHADKYYSREAVLEAWDEFTLWEDVPFDPENQLEVEAIFLPWFVFNWIPDNGELEGREPYPDLPVAMHYLQHRGTRLDSYQRRFIEQACSQSYSFFQVTGVRPGQQLSLRDLLLGREFAVHESQASETLRKGSIIYSRVITLDSISVMLGCAPLAIPPTYINDVIDLRENLADLLGPDFLFECEEELREHYFNIRNELFSSKMPQLQNTDGEPIQQTELYYTLECTPGEALEALATLSLGEDADSLLERGEFGEQGELVSIEFPWLRKGNQQHASWDNTVLGHITIDANQLTISVNSQERAEVIKRKVTCRLGKRAVFRNALIQSMEKMLEEMKSRPPTAAEELARQRNEELQALPEVQAQLREMAQQHWQAWLDRPLPVLKNESPRQAASTKIGRERLEALLLMFEQQNETPQPLNPDIEALRRALGMD